jgi:hypothetical protein
MTGAAINGRPPSAAPTHKWRRERISDGLAEGFVASLASADAVLLTQVLDADGDVTH